MTECEVWKTATLDGRLEAWARIRKDLERTQDPNHSMVFFPNPSRYLFATAGLFWMMDPPYSFAILPQ